MFGLSFWYVYFIINMIYVFVLYKFFHNKLLKELQEKSNFPIEFLEKITKIFYVVGLFLGLPFIILDIFQAIFDPHKSMWVKIWNERKEDKDSE